MLFLEFRWRNYDGSCNNEVNSKWGATDMEYSRWMNANYDDGIFRIFTNDSDLRNVHEFCLFFFFCKGINSIRKCAKSNEELTSPRIIGNTINSAKRKLPYEDNHHSNEIVQNVFAVMFGQAITHDIGKRAVVAIKGLFLHKYINNITHYVHK